jgi:hypothetical protein
MSDAQEEVWAMEGRTERKPLPAPPITGSHLAAAAALFRGIEATAADEWIVGDVGAYGVLPAMPVRPSDQPGASDLLARRELAVRLDGGLLIDDAG